MKIVKAHTSCPRLWATTCSLLVTAIAVLVPHCSPSFSLFITYRFAIVALGVSVCHIVYTFAQIVLIEMSCSGLGHLTDTRPSLRFISFTLLLPRGYGSTGFGPSLAPKTYRWGSSWNGPTQGLDLGLVSSWVGQPGFLSNSPYPTTTMMGAGGMVLYPFHQWQLSNAVPTRCQSSSIWCSDINMTSGGKPRPQTSE